ncbi:MAG: FUSC family protein [Commensalibacter sp.]|nr:FUSC family protein [Commensalibacter sp.]
MTQLASVTVFFHHLTQKFYQKLVEFNNKIPIEHVKWLYFPKLDNIGFSVRTTFSALLALYIAFWLNLGNPHWAAMTVWVVAQKTRGETISKAKWRLVGTITGATTAVILTAAFPQQPGLFIFGLSCIVAICASSATFLKNFRSYALVLTGYTCATIALDTNSDPSNVFMTAISRATYIALGIVIESAVSRLFTPNLAIQGHQKLTQYLQTAIREVSFAIVDLLANKEKADQRSRVLFSTIMALNDQIEYSEQELDSSNPHEGDHARATIAYSCFTLSRGLALAAHIRLLDKNHEVFQEIPKKVTELLEALPELIKDNQNIPSILDTIHNLRSDCRQHMIDTLTIEVKEFLSLNNRKAQSTLNERILHYVMFGLLGELEHVITEYRATQKPIKHDHFKFRMKAHRDIKQALTNGLRSFSAVFFAGLIWLVTAWDKGNVFITFVALASGRYATYDTPHISCIRYFRGATMGFFVAIFLNFIALPTPSDFAILSLFLGPAMFLGGLAAFAPKALTTATAYNMFMLFLIRPENQGRINEIGFFNDAMALLSALAFAILIFYLILPRNPLEERWRLRNNILRDLRRLANSEVIVERIDWLSLNVDRLTRLIKHAPVRSTTLNAYLEGILATTALGLNIIRIREIAKNNMLPPHLHDRVLVVIRRIGQFTGKRHGRTARIARAAIVSLRRAEREETNLTKRLEITRAIAGLTTIAYELEKHEVFLDTSVLFMRDQI